MTMAALLRGQGQSEEAIELFWNVVLLSALSESIDRIAVPVARKVFVDGMMASRDAYVMYLPTEPLGPLLHRRAIGRLAEKGVALHNGSRVTQLLCSDERVTGIVLADGSRRTFDFVVSAVPWRQAYNLLKASLPAKYLGFVDVDTLESAPITAVHLAFERPITPLPHAVLPGRLSQWLFAGPAGDGFQTYQVVISASHALAGMAHEELICRIQAELAAAFPLAAKMRLLHARVVTQSHAIFSPLPGMEDHRPSQTTGIAGLALAGDWTATGWPATMESAVRSGYLAAECILRSIGRPKSILADDLPWDHLARWTLVRSARFPRWM